MLCRTCSTNSGENAPYYNPAADGSLVAGILAEHTLWRHYEDSLVQALTLNATITPSFRQTGERYEYTFWYWAYEVSESK